MTKGQVEELRKYLKEIGSIRSEAALKEIDQLCDLAALGTILRDKWYAEYLQPSAELNYRALEAFEVAKDKWLQAASKEEREQLEYLGRRIMGRSPA